jgi:RNA polymerase sigma-70 factor (ECF subfamily)
MAHSCKEARRERMPVDEVTRLAWQASRLDAAAFGDLYRLFSADVLRYVNARVLGRQEAEDLTNTIFEKAFAAMSRYEPSPAQFSTWLYTIAHNLVIDYYRRRRLPLLEKNETEDLTSADTADGPEARLLADERRRRLYRAIRELTDEQRQVVGCRFFYNLPIHEVARLMGKTEGAVKALQFRALQKLYRQLSSELGPR